MTVDVKRQPGLRAHALEAAQRAVVTFELHQRGMQRRDTVAERVKQARARAVRAQMRGGAAAHGTEHSGRKDALPAGELCAEATAARRHERDDLLPGEQGDVLPVAAHAQHVEDGCGHHRARIDAALLLRRHQAQGGKEGKHLFGRRLLVHALDERRSVSVIRRIHVRVGEVAAAVAGRHDLLAHAVKPLDQRDARAGLRKAGTGGKPGRAAAEDETVGMHVTLLCCSRAPARGARECGQSDRASGRWPWSRM